MNIFINTTHQYGNNNSSIINTMKGYDYEKYVLDNLNNHYDIKEGYLWKDVPDELLIEAGILLEYNTKKIKKRYSNKKNYNYNILIDTGIDIICKLHNDTILLVQCKAYSSTISQKHLSGFYRTILDSVLINGNNNKIKGVIVHTSSLSEIITTSYSYCDELIKDIYMPFYDDRYIDVKKKKNINFYINLNFFITYKFNLFLFLFIFTSIFGSYVVRKDEPLS